MSQHPYLSSTAMRALALPWASGGWRAGLSEGGRALSAWTGSLDWTPDLAQDIGSLRWFRGLATLFVLSGTAIAFWPSFGALPGWQPPPLSDAQYEEVRAQMIAPLALGADSGRHSGANDSVHMLRESPDRPRIELSASVGAGDNLRRVLQRAGVGSDDIARVLSLMVGVADANALSPGTRLDIVLGTRASRGSARPLESLSFRARLDLALSFRREDGALRMSSETIRVDHTPLRIRGTVEGSVFRAARAAGAPADVIEQYLLILDNRIGLGKVQNGDVFDMVVEWARADTGEVVAGDLLYAGLERGGKPRMQMLRWATEGGNQWFEASGVGEGKGQLMRPTAGPVTSQYGLRMHPILRYKRMHSGMDFGGGYGAPIYAVSDGRVTMAGRNGGHGNYVRLSHAGDLMSGYSHMSRIAVSPGQMVRQGQIIGYIGSTGLSTGPHLHYELFRGGVHINPASVSFTQRAALEGESLRAFQAELKRLMAVTPGAALARTKTPTAEAKAPVREIDRLAKDI